MTQTWLLPTLRDIADRRETTAIVDITVPRQREGHYDKRADRQWESAVTALVQTWYDNPDGRCQQMGLAFASPHPKITEAASTLGIPLVPFIPLAVNFQLPPANAEEDIHRASCRSATLNIPLLPTDPLSNEQFCLWITTSFRALFCLGTDDRGNSDFRLTFVPEVIDAAIQALRNRILLTVPAYANTIDRALELFPDRVTDLDYLSGFTDRLLSSAIPQHAIVQPTAPPPPPTTVETNLDIELLRALTHEIRTPMTTIRMLAKSLLRLPEVTPKMRCRLESIEQECGEQIERMELIFSAVEFATEEGKIDLTLMPFSDFLSESLPRWQSTATRRDLEFVCIAPQHLPNILTNPIVLDRVLTGLVESFTRNLPAGSRVNVDINPVGDRLKLQLQSATDMPPTGWWERHQAIGNLLAFQPDTGNLSLNLDVTKGLFKLIGGKLVVREDAVEGEVLTIFLPIEKGSGFTA